MLPRDQWRNFGLKSEGDQAKFLTWYTYKVGGPNPLVSPKITPMYVTACNLEKYFSFVQQLKLQATCINYVV